MQEADYGMTDIAFQGARGRFAADANLLVKFFSHPRPDSAASAEAGRPIFRDTDYVQIMQPGNKDSIIIRPATEMDKHRFAEHYKRYQARQDQESVVGTLLEEWPGVTRAQVEELRYLNIRTVEQLAGLSDTNAQNIMGINGLKTKAKAYLEASNKSATAEALAAANARIDDLIAALEAKGTVVPAAPVEQKASASTPDTNDIGAVLEQKAPTRGRRRAAAE